MLPSQTIALTTKTNMSSPSPSYPPKAHVSSSSPALSPEPAYVTTQPTGRSMSADANRREMRVERNQRIRGGCIPCPVSFFRSFSSHPHADLACRMDPCVGSFHSHAVASKLSRPELVASHRQNIQLFCPVHSICMHTRRTRTLPHCTLPRENVYYTRLVFCLRI